MTSREKELVRAGVRAVVASLFDGLHSEDDHGWDLAKWLEARVDQITNDACVKIDTSDAMLVD